MTCRSVKRRESKPGEPSRYRHEDTVNAISMVTLPVPGHRANMALFVQTAD